MDFFSSLKKDDTIFHQNLAAVVIDESHDFLQRRGLEKGSLCHKSKEKVGLSDGNPILSSWAYRSYTCI